MPASQAGRRRFDPGRPLQLVKNQQQEIGAAKASTSPRVLTSLAVSQHHFGLLKSRSRSETLGYALSGRKIQRLAKSAGRRLKRGRPRTTPRIHKVDLSDLIEATSNGLEASNDNALQHSGGIRSHATSYLSWVADSVQRGNCMIRILLIERRAPVLHTTCMSFFYQVRTFVRAHRALRWASNKLAEARVIFRHGRRVKVRGTSSH